ncbi:MAG TPA: hypothetical protein VGE07_18560 [Herpetosiphonaceae bacterium]
MIDDVVEVTVRDGHATLDRAFVYCWFHPADGSIMFVGATWLHPAARAELHLHGNDPAARIVGAQLEPLGISPDAPLRMLAFPVPAALDRQAARMDLIAALGREGLLAASYFGPAAAQAPADGDAPLGAWTAAVVAHLRADAGK